MDYEKLIQIARERLDNGINRIYQEPDNYSAFWWSESIGTWDEMEALVGDTTDEGIRRDFDEEIDVIQKVLSDMQAAPVSRIGAMSVWDLVAAPIRLKNGTVYRVWSPRELGSGPVVKEMPVESFLYYMVYEWIKLSRATTRLERARTRWAIVALIVLTILFLSYWRTA